MGHIAVQVVLNIAVVTNTIPNTGISLPFISYGGSVASLAAIIIAAVRANRAAELVVVSSVGRAA